MIHTDILNCAHRLTAGYDAARPFPHMVIDDFLNPWIAKQVVTEMQGYNNWSFDSDNHDQGHQVNKYYTPDLNQNPNDLYNLAAQAPQTKMVLDYLNSTDCLRFLEQLTGIDGLLPDMSLSGGGVHKSLNGGKLDVHVDFNVLADQGWHRRINLLIYLNEHWPTEWGGDLQLWEPDLSACATTVAPVFNRAVVFNTTETSYHGHPVPLNCPTDQARYSLALYYYTQHSDTVKPRPVQWHTTN